MIYPEPKKAASMILSKMKDGEEKVSEVKSEESMEKGMEGLDSAAEDILQAIQNKSKIDLRKSLSSFFEMIKSDEDEEMPEGFHS